MYQTSGTMKPQCRNGGPEYAERYPNRIRNFDRFMRRFLTDLQTEVGQRLPTLCFDIGIIDPAALDGQYDYERIKQNVVFFECQMPFTMINYARQSRRNPYGIPRQRQPQEYFVPLPHPLYRP